MRFTITRAVSLLTVSATSLVYAAPAFAQTAAEAVEAESAIVVTGARTTFNNNSATEPMIELQSPITSALALVDNLPGVQVQEGDSFGFDDWSTTVALRGFQTNLDEQQVGITIDGLPNGGSNYGGGAKANRYIDTMNIGGVSVSQGTADIGSLSNEALGGTLDFTTANPLDERRVRFSASLGEFDALRYYARYDTGDLGGVKAWISASHQEATDWINKSAENNRDHVAAKFVAEPGLLRITGYASYDDTHENNYQRVFSAADFAAYPEWDQLTAEWSGIPYIDQSYRKGWATLRKNFFTYLKADADLGSVELSGAAYYHKNNGRGDWVPPYIVNVTDDMGGPESEIVGNGTVYGGPALGRIYFVDGSGVALAAADGCVSSITFPYGGAGPDYDPACYAAGAIGAQSYRHTHYAKDRLGFTADGSWEAQFGMVTNTLRGGLWYEDTTRKEWRDWHQIVDTRVGYEYESPPYWVQYSRKYPQSTIKWFIEDSVEFSIVKATFGVKQFHNELERKDNFDDSTGATLNTTSDLLFSGGIQVTPLPGLDVFGGYAENYKALGDEILERPDADLDTLEPETSENWEAGVRYSRNSIQASAVYFNTKFDNRIIFLAANTDAGPDYLIGTNGTYFNAGGIDSEGFELLVNARILPSLSAYASYTYIDATYKGTGDPLVDEAVGIVPGNRVTGIAKNMFVAALDYNDSRFRAGISGKYTDDRFVDIGNSFVADGYFTVDANIGVHGEALSDMLKGVDLSIVINNVFDEDYLGGISGGGAWIGAPRTAVFTATMDF
ncbi:TonB-dependent receptor [Croceicoccus bisphenolivorans]|uniref:TonB-dependent receptor n=1 Tax=Croceicoccus bisphenolivorans TaxID=1783232 RepID=UPI00082B8A44|nr:TonB-dependent receptor [Croceicoccus bisphenolivorans]